MSYGEHVREYRDLQADLQALVASRLSAGGTYRVQFAIKARLYEASELGLAGDRVWGSSKSLKA